MVQHHPFNDGVEGHIALWQRGALFLTLLASLSSFGSGCKQDPGPGTPSEWNLATAGLPGEVAPFASGSNLMAFDSRRQRIVLVQGSRTWEWDSVAWSQMVPSEGSFSPQFSADSGLTYDAARGQLVGFHWNDIYINRGTGWRHLAAAGVRPVSYWGARLVYDAAREEVVLFGGSGFEEDGETYLLVAETLTFDGSAWSPTEPGPSPSPTVDHAMVYDAHRERVVLFHPDGETWEWDGEAWEQRETPGDAPSPRTRPVLAFDASSSRVILFGGVNTNGLLGDTWAWDGTRWTDLTDSLSTAPTPRAGASAAYDATREELVLFGGDDGSIGFRDTWRFGSTEAPPAPTPPVIPSSRSGYGAAYDVARNRLVIFGGDPIDGPPTNETWEFDGERWLERLPESGASVPSPRAGAAMGYDPVRETVVLFGGRGRTAAGRVDLGDTWEWDGDRWTQIESTDSPPAQSYMDLVYGPAGGRLVLYGASGQTDVWSFDGENWTVLGEPDGPTPTGASSLVTFDVGRGLLVAHVRTYGTYVWDGMDWSEDIAISPSNDCTALTYDVASARLMIACADLFRSLEISVSGPSGWELSSVANPPGVWVPYGVELLRDATGRTLMVGPRDSALHVWAFTGDAWVSLLDPEP